MGSRRVLSGAFESNWLIEFQGGFGSSLMLKDLGLAQDAANRTGSATPLGSLSLQVNNA